MRFAARIWRICRYLPVILLAAAAQAPTPAPATAPAPAPAAIQRLITSGQTGTAIQELDAVLQTHPKDPVAWYLLAQAFDAQGNETSADDALNMAIRAAPGLAFADPQQLAALQAHINAALAKNGGGGQRLGYEIIGGVVALLLLVRILPQRQRRASAYIGAAPPPGTPPYGFGYNPQDKSGLLSTLTRGLKPAAQAKQPPASPEADHYTRPAGGDDLSNSW